MTRTITCIICAGALVVASASGCNKPTSSSSPGTACFSIFKTGSDGTRVNDVSTVKVGEEVAVDLSCAGSCAYRKDVNWGDGYWGEYTTHKYDKTGTYTVKFTCSTQTKRHSHTSSYSRRHKYHGGVTSRRYESSKTLAVTQ